MTPNPTTTTTTTTTDAGRELEVRRPDGRTIAVLDQGRVGGPPVVFLHAAPGSRRFDPDPAATAAAGIRLVTIDRAGYGGSSPIGDGEVPTVAGHADDAAAVLDHLEISDAVVIGWSAGGRVALALAARRPDLVRRVAVVATPAPDAEVPWVAPEHRAMAEELRADPASAVATMITAFTEQGPPAGAGDDAREGAGSEPVLDDGITDMVTRGGAVDAALLEDRAIRGRVAAMLAEAFRFGPAGVATDIVADQVVPWGFDVAAVGAPVTLVYGEADEVLRPDHGRWYADRLADSTLRVVAGAGHLVIVTEWAALLTEATT